MKKFLVVAAAMVAFAVTINIESPKVEEVDVFDRVSMSGLPAAHAGEWDDPRALVATLTGTTAQSYSPSTGAYLTVECTGAAYIGLKSASFSCTSATCEQYDARPDRARIRVPRTWTSATLSILTVSGASVTCYVFAAP